MTKNLKIAAIVSAAALLAIGASMTSFAATGWVEEDGAWKYYTKAGDQVTDTWEKSGSNWFYLDNEGTMATDSLIEDNDNYYYVDANGAMVTNQWIQMENEDAGDEDQPDTWWYYFQANGKAYKRSTTSTSISLKTINGKKYTFDDDGHMQYGWIKHDDGTTNYDDNAWQEAEYYFGDENDGAMTMGWREISITDDNADDDSSKDSQPGDSYWDTDQTRWFYFKSSGKKQTNNTNKAINGKKYGFDTYGRMVASWYTGTPSTASASLATPDTTYSKTFLYFSSPEDGARYTKGWFKVVPGYFLNKSDYDDGSDKWFYATGDGTIAAGEFKTIKGKKYGFKPNGEMISGLAILNLDKDGSIIAKVADDSGKMQYDSEDDFKATIRGTKAGKADKYAVTGSNLDAFGLDDDTTMPDYAVYYFSADEDHDGSMKTGTQTVSIDGDKFSFKFRKDGSRKGQGYMGLQDKKYYLGGMLLKAGSDDKAIVLDTTALQTTTVGEMIDGVTAKTYSKGASDDNKVNVIGSDGTTVATTFTKKDGYYYYVPTYHSNWVLINTAGSLVKNSSKKNGDGYTIHTDNSGCVLYIEYQY